MLRNNNFTTINYNHDIRQHLIERALRPRGLEINESCKCTACGLTENAGRDMQDARQICKQNSYPTSSVHFMISILLGKRNNKRLTLNMTNSILRLAFSWLASWSVIFTSCILRAPQMCLKTKVKAVALLDFCNNSSCYKLLTNWQTYDIQISNYVPDLFQNLINFISLMICLFPKFQENLPIALDKQTDDDENRTLANSGEGKNHVNADRDTNWNCISTTRCQCKTTRNSG